jgi:hypothetical protein
MKMTTSKLGAKKASKVSVDQIEKLKNGPQDVFEFITKEDFILRRYVITTTGPYSFDGAPKREDHLTIISTPAGEIPHADYKISIKDFFEMAMEGMPLDPLLSHCIW